MWPSVWLKNPWGDGLDARMHGEPREKWERGSDFRAP